MLICSNLSGSVGIGVDLYESCIDLKGSMWICTKLHDTVLICVSLYGSVLICAILCESPNLIGSVRMCVDMYKIV